MTVDTEFGEYPIITTEFTRSPWHERIMLALASLILVVVTAGMTLLVLEQRHANMDAAERFERTFEQREAETSRLLEGIGQQILGQTCVLALDPSNRSQDNVNACFIQTSELAPEVPADGNVPSTSPTTSP